MRLPEARLALERLLAEAADPDDEQSVTIGFVDGAEVCLVGWRDRPIKDITAAEAHANRADCMQIVLAGGMQIRMGDGVDLIGTLDLDLSRMRSSPRPSRRGAPA